MMSSRSTGDASIAVGSPIIDRNQIFRCIYVITAQLDSNGGQGMSCFAEVSNDGCRQSQKVQHGQPGMQQNVIAHKIRSSIPCFKSLFGSEGRLRLKAHILDRFSYSISGRGVACHRKSGKEIWSICRIGTKPSKFRMKYSIFVVFSCSNTTCKKLLLVFDVMSKPQSH